MDKIELIGWVGASSLLLAFGLNLFNIINVNNKIYLILNFFASLLLLYNAWVTSAYPFVAVNLVWVIFSFFKLIKSQ